MENTKIRCPICETIGEKNTFCETCRWFLNDSLDYYSLSSLSSDAICKFNDNIKNYRILWKNFAEKEQSKETIQIQKQLQDLQERLQKMQEQFTQRFDLLEKTFFDSSTDKSNAKVVLEDPQPFPAEVSTTKEEICEPENNSDVKSNYFFGSYPQNIEEDQKEIEWIVLTKENNKGLLISKYALDCKPYNTKRESTTWEDCTLRNWLNTDFITSAFTAAEQEKILTIKVPADKNPDHYTNAGNDTLDRIFLLSIDEVKKYFNADKAIPCEATDYAKSQGIRIYKGHPNCWWWLRSPGKTQVLASCINGFGDTDKIGCTINYNHCAVRPALWVYFND